MICSCLARRTIAIRPNTRAFVTGGSRHWSGYCFTGHDTVVDHFVSSHGALHLSQRALQAGRNPTMSGR
jgi:hypothetical protein